MRSLCVLSLLVLAGCNLPDDSARQRELYALQAEVKALKSA